MAGIISGIFPGIFPPKDRSKEKENLIAKAQRLNRQSDVMWRKGVLIVWGLALLYIIYLGFVWLMDKIGL